MTHEEELALYRRLAVSFGRKGGRPRTIIHEDGDPKCGCVACREAKAKVAKKRVKKGEKEKT